MERAKRGDFGHIRRPLRGPNKRAREQIGILHRRLLAIVRNDAVCRRLMTVPGAALWHCLSRHRRRAIPFQKLQGGRGGIWTDAL